MKQLDNIVGCEEISHREMLSISGGESIAYWIGYAIGKAAKAIENALQCSCTCHHQK